MAGNVTIIVSSEGTGTTSDDLRGVVQELERMESSGQQLSEALDEVGRSMDNVQSSGQGASGVISEQGGEFSQAAESVGKFLVAHAATAVALEGARRSWHRWGDGIKAAGAALIKGTVLMHGARKASGALRTTIENAAAASQKARAGFEMMGAGLSRVVGIARVALPILGAAGLVAIIGGLNARLAQFGAAGSQVEIVEAAFDRLASRAGTTGDVLRTNLSEAVRDSASDLELMQTSVIALNSGAIDTDETLVELARHSQVLAQTVGMDVNQAFNNAVRGIGLVNPALLKSIGVLVSAEEAYRNYAQANNTAVGALTDHQRHEAFRIEVMERMRQAVANVTDETGQLVDADANLALQLQRANAGYTNFVNSMRQAVGGSRQLALLLKDVQDLFEGLGDSAESGGAVALEVITDLIAGAGRLAVAVAKVPAQAGEGITTSLAFEDDMRETARVMADVEEELEQQQFEILRKQNIFHQEFVRDWQQLNNTFGAMAPPELPSGFGRVGPSTRQESLFGLSQENFQATASRLEQMRTRLADLRRDLGLMPEQWQEQRQEIIQAQFQVRELERELELQLASARSRMREAGSDMAAMAVDASRALVQGVRSEFDRAFMDIPQDWRAMLAEMRAEASRFGGPLQMDMPDLPGGNRFTRAQEFISQRAEMGIGPDDLVGFTEAQQAQEAIATMREQREAQQQWAEAMGETTEATTEAEQQALIMAGTTIANFGAMAQAAIRGSEQMAQSVINAFTQILQTVANQQNWLSGLGVPLIGAVGGIISAVVASGSRDRTQPVRVEEYGSRAKETMRQNVREETVTIVLTDAQGRETERRTFHKLRQFQARDGVERVPVG